jgi:hypothetical protein
MPQLLRGLVIYVETMGILEDGKKLSGIKDQDEK